MRHIGRAADEVLDAGAGLAPPPGPALPAETQARLWLEAPVALLENARADCGDVFLLRLGSFGSLAIVAAPEGVRQVLSLPPELYECRQFNEGYRYAMGDEALFLKDGERHRRLKAILRPLFGPAALSAHARTVGEEARAALSVLPRGEAVRLRPLTHEIALRSLLRLVLGDGAGEAREGLVARFRERVWRDLRAWKPWTALSRLRPGILALLDAAIAERRARPGAFDDLLARLVDARDPAGAGLGDAEIRDQVTMLMITAGDAVAVAAAWGLHRLACAPEVHARLRAEAEGDDPARTWLDATCREVLRLHPVLPTVSGRRLLRPVAILGHRIDAGVTLAPCGYLAHRRADVFEDPLAFRPERFIGRSYAPHEFFPFGGAERACLGSVLAPMTLRAVLDAAAGLHRLAPAAPGEPESVRLGTLVAPHEDLAVVAHPPEPTRGTHA